MTKILSIDKYQTLYDFEQANNPDAMIGHAIFRKADVEAVDRLLELSRGNRETVKTDDDWNVLANIIVFYIQRWPEEWAEFRSSMPEIRGTRNAGGYSKTKEMVYLASLPFRLERLIKTIFPNQQYDKKFMYKFIKRFRIFQVAGEGN
jgi:hypothetical protein